MTPVTSSLDGFLTHKAAAEWHQALARLFSRSSTAEFPEHLTRFLRQITDIQSILISTYKGRARPLMIRDDYASDLREHAIGRYLGKAYLLDPFFTAIQRGADQGGYSLRELAPDRFHESEYYQYYYRALDLSDEVGILARVDANVVMMVSLGFREECAPLTRRSLHALRSVAPVLQVMLTEFWHWQAGLFQSHTDTQAPIEVALASFGEGLLTPREQEIVHLLLAGHSTKSAARELGISDGTVKVHRKNLYQRLDISTQSQLFRLFLDHVALVSRRQPGGPDPA